MKVFSVAVLAGLTTVSATEFPNCKLPTNSVAPWWFTSKVEGPYRCDTKNDNKPWAMLNSFRDGGVLLFHYKLTNDVNDPECLTNWTYYKSDGKTVITQNVERTIKPTIGLRWCPLPVYQIGGVQGKQWEYCDCSTPAPTTTAPPPTTTAPPPTTTAPPPTTTAPPPTTTAPPPTTTAPPPTTTAPPAVTTAPPTTPPPRVVCPDGE